MLQKMFVGFFSKPPKHCYKIWILDIIDLDHQLAVNRIVINSLYEMRQLSSCEQLKADAMWPLIWSLQQCNEYLFFLHQPMERGRVLRRPHFLSNANTALRFLAGKRIKLVNINAADLVDGRPAVVLGLIWTIILYFQVRMLLLIRYSRNITNFLFKRPNYSSGISINNLSDEIKWQVKVKWLVW